MKIFSIFALCFIACGQSDSGFYFPDQISSHAKSHSEAGVDANGNVHAGSESQAGVQHQVHGGEQLGNHYPDQTGNGLIHSQGPFPGGFPNSHGFGTQQGNGHNYQETGPGYAHQNSNPSFLGNAQSQSTAQSSGNGALANSQSGSQTQGGLAQSQSSSQSQSSGFQNGYPYNSVAGSTSGSQSNNAFGGSSAASAASAASTSFLGGIPVASASAAAAAASAGPGGASSSSANSAASSSGFSGGFPRYPNGWYLAGRMGGKEEGEDSVSESSEDDSESHEE